MRKKQPLSKKERRIAINRQNARKKKKRQHDALYPRMMADPCFAAGFDLSSAPHGPKCLCLIMRGAMYFLQHFIGKSLPKLSAVIEPEEEQADAIYVDEEPEQLPEVLYENPADFFDDNQIIALDEK